MNDKDDDKQGLLDFLTDNLFGRERDAVTRAFYEYAEGDSLLGGQAHRRRGRPPSVVFHK